MSSTEDENNSPYSFKNVVSKSHSTVSKSDEEVEVEVIEIKNVSKTRNLKRRSVKKLDSVGENLVRPAPRNKSNVKVCVVLDSDEELDVESHLKVMWKPTYEFERFSLKKQDKIAQIFEHFSNKKGISVDKISIKLSGKLLCPFDTLESLRIGIKDVLIADIENSKDCDSSTKISVKCRTKDRRTPFTFLIHPQEPLESLFQMCADELNCPKANVRIQFDGDEIKYSETAESLEIENDDCFDVYTVEGVKRRRKRR